MFKEGQIVKSKQRTEKYPLFLMVILDHEPSSIQFNAVVLKDCGSDFKAGYITNTWNTSKFEISNFKDFKKYI